MRTWLKRAAALALLALALFAAKLIVDAGAFRTITPHFAGTATRTLPGITGPEDVEFVGSRTALLISADNRPARPGDPTPDGAIWSWPLRGDPRNLTAAWKPPFAFHPHGITSWILPDRTLLWVINHRETETSIELFVYTHEGNLTFVKSLRDPLLATANDLVAVSESQFYVTSDHGTDSHALGRLEDYTRIGRGYVSYFDGQRFEKKATGISYANGITLSAPPSDPAAKLLVASMLGKSIRIYDRNAQTGDLTLASTLALDGAPDNITRDSRGAIWVGAHPKMFALKAMNEDRKRRAPAQVLKITGITTPTPEIEEVMMDDGSKISAVSVALRDGKRLYLGSVFDDRLLDCDLP